MDHGKFHLGLLAEHRSRTCAGWWTHGEIEVGGRDFVNNPAKGGSLCGDTAPGNAVTGGYAYLGQHSLAKYYEYSMIAPGAFGGGHVATGSKDGLYQVDLWANNVGSYFDSFSDQSYLLSASKVGEQYFSAAGIRRRMSTAPARRHPISGSEPMR